VPICYLILKLDQLWQAVLSKDSLRILCSPRVTVFEGESGDGTENLGRAESLVNTGLQRL